MDSSSNIKCQACSQLNSVMKRCTRCEGIFYCSRSCQVADWPQHKLVCRRRPDDAATGQICQEQDLKETRIHELNSESQRIPAERLKPNEPNRRTTSIDFQKALDSCKSRTANSTSAEGQRQHQHQKQQPSTKQPTYILNNTVLSDLPTLSADHQTCHIIVKGNKTKLQLTMPLGWSGPDTMKMFSHHTAIPLDRIKLIHKGRVVTEANMTSVLKDKAVFQVMGEQAESESDLDPGDVAILMSQLSVGRNTAVRALRQSGSLLDAMLYLGNK